MLYIYKGCSRQLIRPIGLQINGMSAQHFFIWKDCDNTGHRGLYKTYQNLTDSCNCKDSYSDINRFVQSCQVWQGVKSSTQKPVELLIPLTVPQRPCIEIAMDFLFSRQLAVDCHKVIPGMKFSNVQKAHFITFCKVLIIIDMHSGNT